MKRDVIPRALERTEEGDTMGVIPVDAGENTSKLRSASGSMVGNRLCTLVPRGVGEHLVARGQSAKTLDMGTCHGHRPACSVTDKGERCRHVAKKLPGSINCGTKGWRLWAVGSDFFLGEPGQWNVTCWKT